MGPSADPFVAIHESLADRSLERWRNKEAARVCRGAKHAARVWLGRSTNTWRSYAELNRLTLLAEARAAMFDASMSDSPRLIRAINVG